ncbi:hypothetical protein [Vreelandella titanicae]|jgi:hypothetical protein|uniref:hypothetical protein n=1 Tax=Vreelandella titanicae TaxID=664683 RepID=UPI001593DF0B|nr:hypothetical protein [Halomonas titanicae]NVE91572.1 hypothetical protein [Halomonas titanicae]|tara:strand:+ start:189 stop:830 length:642 start_codon:yes stop_codon:yes gene_type:complete
MTLKATCPECGMSGDMAAFVTQGEHNQALAAALEMPALLSSRIVRYLGMFRPASRALASAKSARLLSELKETINSGVIERKGTTREAPLKVWVMALDQMLESPPSGLPLSGHGYLYEVVARCADRHAGEVEKQREEQARSGAKQPANRPTAAALRERSTDDVLAEHARMANRQSTVTASPKGQRQNAKAVEQANAPKRLSDLLKGAANAGGQQ